MGGSVCPLRLLITELTMPVMLRTIRHTPSLPQAFRSQLQSALDKEGRELQKCVSYFAIGKFWIGMLVILCANYNISRLCAVARAHYAVVFQFIHQSRCSWIADA